MRSLTVLNSSPRFRRQSGFTLVEILIALALITLLAVGITLSFDGSRSRAQALISNMSELAAANVRLKNDMGCYVSKPGVLLTPTALPANNYCSITTTTTWNGPYVSPFATDSATGLLATMDKVAQGVTVDFQKSLGGANPFGANGTNYFVEASNVPADVVQQALQECNGTTTAPAVEFTGVKCGAPDATTFDLLYDQTR